MHSLNVATLLTLINLTRAHFSLTTPTSLGLNLDAEDTGPCGGISFSPSSSVTDFHVEGDAVGVKTLHPQANILIRGTLDTDATGNWTDLFPVVGQYGLGDFCEPQILAPFEWAGRIGLVQVIESSVDGLLYQCAAVKFVNGTMEGVPSTCSNGTGVVGSFTSDDKLPTAGSSDSGSSSSTSASAGPSTSLTPSGGNVLEAKGKILWAGIGSVVALTFSGVSL